MLIELGILAVWGLIVILAICIVHLFVTWGSEIPPTEQDYTENERKLLRKHINEREEKWLEQRKHD